MFPSKKKKILKTALSKKTFSKLLPQNFSLKKYFFEITPTKNSFSELLSQKNLFSNLFFQKKKKTHFQNYSLKKNIFKIFPSKILFQNCFLKKILTWLIFFIRLIRRRKITQTTNDMCHYFFLNLLALF